MADRKFTNKELYEMIVQGNEGAWAIIVREYWEKIELHLRYKWPGERKEVIEDAMGDAFFDFYTKAIDPQGPGSYDPEKSRIITFLKKAAERNMINEWRKRERRNNSPFDEEDVQHSGSGGNSKQEPVFSRQIEAIEIRAELIGHLRKILKDETDVRIATMMRLDKVRERYKYAEVLGKSHLPESARDKQVDDTKGRINKKLDRSEWNDIIKKYEES